MEIDISGRHFHVTEPLKKYALDKVKKLDKYSLKIETAHVIFDVQKFYQITEIVLSANHMRLAAKEQSTDMYSAFDKCFDNIQLQMRRQHDKRKEHKGRRYWPKGAPAPKR